MTSTIPVRIGTLTIEVQRHLLTPAEAAFPLQLTVREIRNAIRRAALPLVLVGRTNRIDAVALSQILVEREELLAVEFIRGWAEGRFDMPRPGSEDAPPPTLGSRLDLLRRTAPDAAQKSAVKYRTSGAVFGPSGRK